MILFCGYANVDVVARIPRLPDAGGRVHAGAIDQWHGGMGANAAVAAARMGATAAFGGAVGAEPVDRAFLAALSAEGVDVGWCHTDTAVPTAIVLVTPDGERAVISRDDALNGERLAAGVRRLADSGGGWLYLDGYRWPEAADILDATPGADRIGVFVDLDGCEDPAAARVALDRADHATAGRAQLAALFGAPGGDPAVLARRHATVLVATDGADGWRLARPDGGSVRGAAMPVDASDATGAGDCFAGCYLAAIDAGADPVDAARTAAVAAALSCTVPGARGAPLRAEVDALLAGGAAAPDAAPAPAPEAPDDRVPPTRSTP
ncbi:ribokinase/sulfofructose kinase [Murinocardiopsis flavida]|uniref:Ribokinase/sulfofructose kinase n=1 Tax=Murinocardiopsis flavida TaxID=645275 RepID=A0A2P8DRU4_9ACTN|nr:carbohydrate kinase family protein [Murinocardiopsis flavida]PSK99935.1 ribokinase/sulfofructose kinase [Murinocardiopsis flavida]